MVSRDRLNPFRSSLPPISKPPNHDDNLKQILFLISNLLALNSFLLLNKHLIHHIPQFCCRFGLGNRLLLKIIKEDSNGQRQVIEVVGKSSLFDSISYTKTPGFL